MLIFCDQVEYAAMPLGDLMVHLDEKDEHQQKWDATRDATIELMKQRGMKGCISEEDLDRETQVVIKESDGEEEWDEGKNFRLDVFDALYPPESSERKALGMVKVVSKISDLGKEEGWVYVFNEEEGLKSFKL